MNYLERALLKIKGWDERFTKPFIEHLKTVAANSGHAESKIAARILRLAENVAQLKNIRKEINEALRQYTGYKMLCRWARMVSDTNGQFFTKNDLDMYNYQQTITHGKEMLKSLKYRLTNLGINEALTYDRYNKFEKMLPEEYIKAVKLHNVFKLYNFKSDREPDWIFEPPDLEILTEHQKLLPDDVLVNAWNDRWVTADTAAGEFGISVNRIRNIVSELETVEVKNPHYRSASPMVLIKLSSLRKWAGKHSAEIRKWAEASKRAKEIYQKKLNERVQQLRVIPDLIKEKTDDPAPRVCFWLSLLNRAAKTGYPELYDKKDYALRKMIKAGVKYDLFFIKGGDKKEKVWLCDNCYDNAMEMGMHPLDYIEEIGPCKNCTVEPAIKNYYDLYELKFSFPKIGMFCYHVPYSIGREYLPDPEKLSKNVFRDRDEEESFTFGRSLNKIELTAFKIEEIINELEKALKELPVKTKDKVAIN
jgi:hypothetical protein